MASLRRAATTALLAAVLAVPAACTSAEHGRPVGTGASTTAPTTSQLPGTTTAAPSTTVAPPPPDRAHRLLARMTPAQRVGQLFMVDCPTSGITQATLQAIRTYGVGAVILDRTSYAPSSTIANLTGRLESANPSAAKLFIATDQEGGQVQRLRGTGFSSIPSGLDQGTLTPDALQADAQRWGRELRAAGVNVDLAPVLDTVPPGSPGNPPIGDLDREYGRNPASVAASGTAVARGLAASGVAASAKHFPGLGRVAGNTDTTAGVTDSVTTRTDPYLAPFAAAVRDNVPFVMMSTATYTRIDPTGPAAFSPTVIGAMLRGDLHFTGVVISDDLGTAAQVRGYPVGARAVSFIAAGGDMVLTVDATQAQAMTAAVLARATSDPVFGHLVDLAAARVLEAKDRFGLLS